MGGSSGLQPADMSFGREWALALGLLVYQTKSPGLKPVFITPVNRGLKPTAPTRFELRSNSSFTPHFAVSPRRMGQRELWVPRTRTSTRPRYDGHYPPHMARRRAVSPAHLRPR